MTFTVLAWFAEARNFTHQQRLTLEVAAVLTGQKTEGGLIAKAWDAGKNLPKPSTPATTSLKKVELAVEATSEILPLALRAGFLLGGESVMPELARSAPPHEPPRFGRLV